MLIRKYISRLIFLLGCSLFLLLPKSAHAQNFAENRDQFDTSLKATYEVLLNGNTKVSQEFTITNKTPQYFIKEYAIIVGSNTVEGITVTENGKELPANVVVSRNQTSISIAFSDELVGQGKSRRFVVSYESPDIALVSGNALEVSIPRLAEEAKLQDYTVIIKTPIKFGSASKSNPPMSNWTITATHIVTEYQHVGSQSILAFFGFEQFYDLTLRYHLSNPTDGSGIIQIALPPDMQHQRMKYVSIDPTPLAVAADPDGNWIADYKLGPKEQLSVNVLAQVKVSLDPIPNIPEPPVLSQYTAEDTFWPSKSKQIKQFAQSNQGVENIYRAVIDSLNYNYQKIGDVNVRLGAEKALQQPDNAVCQEFTDVFIAAARAEGIPSRRLTGFALSQNSILKPLSLVQDVLHTWPEYYDGDQKRWVQVDPTWEKTTGGINYFDQLDLSHIVFAINGSSSETPYPAGAYKVNGENTKDIEVRFADDFVEESPVLQQNAVPQQVYGIPWLGKYALQISNQSGQAWYDIPIAITTSEDAVASAKTDKIAAILPFQTITVPITVEAKQWFDFSNKQLTVALGSETQNYHVIANKKELSLFFNPISVLAVGACVVTLTLLAGSIFLFKRKR